jgi:spore coat protein CotH
MRTAITSILLIALLVPRAMSQEKVFGLDKVHEFHLEVSAKEWAVMQKVEAGRTLFGAKKFNDDIERHMTAGFGLAFPWAHADLHAGGKVYKDVGLRYKGNGSYVSTDKMLKRNLKIEIDHYDDDQRFHGLKTITLNAGAVDASRMREALAYSVFRAAKVPAPRTAFARLTLTVPGKHDKELVGLYTFVEHADKDFLKLHFKDGKGLLMKPEGLRGIEFLGEDWAKYKNRYRSKRDATAAEAKHIIEFARLVSKGDDASFKKQIGDYLDVDNFLRFAAVNTMLPNTDSFFTTGHNYYLYLNSKTNKLAFMPWDLDIAFAGFPAMGSIDQQATMNLLKPGQGRMKLVDRLLAIPDVNGQYQKILKEIAESAFTKKKLLADIDTIEKATKDLLALEKKAVEARKDKRDGFSEAMAGWFAPAEMRSFVERRADEVGKQIAVMEETKK